MKYLLDANAVIALLNGHPTMNNRIRVMHPSDIGLPAIVAHELYYGAFKSMHQERNVGLVDALQFAVLTFDQEDARQAGAIRAELAKQGQPIGPYDVLIAGQAKARGLTLVTHNMAEFNRVSGLVVEDWEAE
ncbi:MAG: type II toxin-antitoxin system VapC family toxin [Rhodocyclaceae bacterium]|nr:type II toxin-antitoxin system VapC family toxin [Rhodocyclaceae bacterium]